MIAEDLNYADLWEMYYGLRQLAYPFIAIDAKPAKTPRHSYPINKSSIDMLKVFFN